MKKQRSLFILISLLCYGELYAETQLNARFIHYDREFSNQLNDRLQNGSSVILSHQQALFNNLIELQAAAYTAQKFTADGRQREDVFALDNNNKVNSFALLGEANLRLNLTPQFSIKIGRSKHKSLLLQSKSRALHSTFEGVNIHWKNTNTQIYAHRFTKWSRRSSAHFTSFSTRLSNEGAIDYLTVIGASYSGKSTLFEQYKIQTEWLEAKNYLRKWGLNISAKKRLNSNTKLTLNAAAFTSSDAGDLFIQGANTALDLPITESFNNQSTRLKHRGLGAYATAKLKYKSHTIALTRTQIGDPWLEDSFAQDHGTTPFPTRTFGPELTNRNETIWLFEYEYAWNKIITGLNSKFRYAKGTGAENSISPTLGLASEQWFETDWRYQPPKHPNISARLRYRDYQSSIDGEVAGVGSDRNELRFTIDWQYIF